MSFFKKKLVPEVCRSCYTGISMALSLHILLKIFLLKLTSEPGEVLKSVCSDSKHQEFFFYIYLTSGGPVAVRCTLACVMAYLYRNQCRNMGSIGRMTCFSERLKDQKGRRCGSGVAHRMTE
jgi:hypothetical protein